eukprot:CAMPEP_0170566412 /NCGR_PEP_ID=MMETSP0211-20121228/79821_1 /TAXON_ID=311385 /ORGANISM="Pseudokeronopsis sp., Strain OXSARD2" /LENGTH=84 /DNA_ID=CAMNT_0010887575 /DNA_START=802 /DNA_END=1056 /DNA_ORIENTATION=-
MDQWKRFMDNRNEPNPKDAIYNLNDKYWYDNMDKLKEREERDKDGRMNTMRAQKSYLDRQMDVRNNLKERAQNEKQFYSALIAA